MSSATGSSTAQAASRVPAMILMAFGVICLIVGIVFIATNHDLRATASFIVGVLALAGGGFMLMRKPK